MVFDWDDHHPGNDAMPRLRVLKELRPDFKATLFTIPALSPDGWVDAHPDWVELWPHGYFHGDPPVDGGECKNWTYRRTQAYIRLMESRTSRWVRGTKAPGWQISDDAYSAFADAGWLIADQHLEDRRRPPMWVYFYEDGHFHGHVQNCCGNGLQETWEYVRALVRETREFQFASESLTHVRSGV